jgi:ectoine hydroxylase-related dioxygenase (phytanoyl-CoA dioxygenase family)
MNRRPLNEITESDIETYRRDGVVCIRGILDAEWIQRMQDAIARISEAPERYGLAGPSHGKMISISYLWRNDADFRDFAMTSPVGEVVGRVIGANRIQLYHDHLFVKPPASPSIMRWHADETAWPVTGEMAPNIWTAFSTVNEQNGRIEYLAGWHRHCIENGLRFGFKPDQGDGPCPDFETERDNPDFPFKFVSFDMDPGDCVVFHPHTPHFSKGNGSPTMARQGLAVRMFGDDVVWHTPSYKVLIPGIDNMPAGEHPDDPLLPTIWTRPPEAIAA